MPAPSGRGDLFYAVEIEARDLTVELEARYGHLTRPRFTPAPPEEPIEVVETLRFSDAGYRSRGDDAVRAVYPPLLDGAFEVDRALPLAPGASAAGAAWGTLRLFNPRGRLDGLVATRGIDGRVVRVLAGRKALCPVRGIRIDPPYADLSLAFAGTAGGWRVTETAVEVPLRDATYHLERPVQPALYAGTGGAEGAAALTGTPKPMVRGGTSTDPVRDVSVLLIDPSTLTAQVTDGPMTVHGVYEAGAGGLIFQGDTTNLWSGSTAPSHYRTDVSKGLIQFGSQPQGPITVDVAGRFRTGATATTAAAIAKRLLLDDAGLDPALLDTAAFDVLDAAYPWVSGWAFGAVAGLDAVDAATVFLQGIGAKLIPTRDGRLTCIALRALSGSETPAARWTTDEVEEVAAVALPAPLDPPAVRWRVAHQRCHTVQTTGLSPLLTDATRLQFLGSEWRFSAVAFSAVQMAYRRPSDPDPVPTGLLRRADADLLAAALGDLWSANRRHLFDITVPFRIGVSRDLGDVVRITFPVADLRAGALGRIVGERFRAGSPSITFRVLV